MDTQPLKIRKRKCRVCKTPFEPRSSLQVVCSPKCSIEYSRELQEKKRRRELKLARIKLKTLSDWLADAQVVFNRYIRMRDAHLPCVSCGRFHQGKWNAGHYRTVAAAPELRFDELNVWKQCEPCNSHKSGDIVNYRKNLYQRIGEPKLEWLEGPHEPKRYRIEDCKRIIATYKAKIKALKDRKHGHDLPRNPSQSPSGAREHQSQD